MDLKVKKTTGLDGISARFLKDGPSVIVPTVTFLVNLSLSTGIVRCDWNGWPASFLHISRVDMKVWTIMDQSAVMSKIMQRKLSTFNYNGTYRGLTF